MDYFVQGCMCSHLVNDIIHNVDDIQKAASRALAAALVEHEHLVGSVLEQLIELYKKRCKVNTHYDTLIYFLFLLFRAWLRISFYIVLHKTV